MNQHWASVGEAGALSGLRLMVWIYRHCGRWAFDVVLAPVMLYFLLRRPLARRASRDFLKRVFRRYPDAFEREPGLWMTYLHFYRFGQALLDKYLAWIDAPAEIAMDPEQERLLLSTVDSGRGCLLIASHFGNLEYARGISHRHEKLVMNVLIHDKHAANFAALFTGAAPQSRLNLIQVTELDIELALRLKEKIDAGQWVVIAGDRIPVAGGTNVTPATFFGEPADFPVGPYVLARLLGCPVYLMHCFRIGEEYRLGFEFFADRIRPARVRQGRSYGQEVQRYASALEAQVRKAPLQWFNFYDFWAEHAIEAQAEGCGDEAVE